MAWNFFSDQGARDGAQQLVLACGSGDAGELVSLTFAHAAARRREQSVGAGDPWGGRCQDVQAEWLARLAPLVQGLEMSFSPPAASVIGIAIAVLCSRSAFALGGEGAGAGPVFAISHRGSLSLGWEGAISPPGAPFSRLSIGGSYHPEPDPDDPAYFHYIAWEPWAYVGATLGAALTSDSDVRFAYGLWEAYPAALGANLVDSNHEFLWVASLAVGWRGVGSMQQFYLTPKLWFMRGYDFFS